jgi:hypothetical protein
MQHQESDGQHTVDSDEIDDASTLFVRGRRFNVVERIGDDFLAQPADDPRRWVIISGRLAEVRYEADREPA